MPNTALNPAGMTLALVRNPEAFFAMRAEWDDLMLESNAAVFNSWEWLYPWYKHMGRGRDLRILTARDETGRLVGVMPLCLQRMWMGGRTLRRLAFLGETHLGSDYLDIIARRDCEQEVTAAFVRALKRSSRTWDVLDLLDVNSQSLTLRALRDAFEQGEYCVEVSPRSICPCETFKPSETFDGFLRRTKRRANYRRRKKWLEQQPGYRITCETEPENVSKALDELMRLHALRWAVEGGSEAINSAKVIAFHRDATRLLAERGLIRMFVMEVEGRAVASVYGIVHNATFHYYQSGRDPEWHSKSVGLVLVGETFRSSLEAGLRSYDFLQGEEHFKSEWTSDHKETVGIRIYRSQGIGMWLGRREHAIRVVKDYAKRVLPEKWAHRLTHWLHKF